VEGEAALEEAKGRGGTVGEGGEEGGRVVGDDREAAAVRGARGAEGGKDGVAAGFEGAEEPAGVGGAVLGRDEEMEEGAVVPQAVAGGREGDAGDIAGEPADVGGGGAEARAGHGEGVRGEIEDSEAGEGTGEKIVDEGGGAAAGVEDGGVRREAEAVDEVQGDVEVGRGPAERGGGLGAVDGFPVGLGVHAEVSIEIYRMRGGDSGSSGGETGPAWWVDGVLWMRSQTRGGRDSRPSSAQGR
jgi:hypothetical protein